MAVTNVNNNITAYRIVEGVPRHCSHAVKCISTWNVNTKKEREKKKTVTFAFFVRFLLLFMKCENGYDML